MRNWQTIDLRVFLCDKRKSCRGIVSCPTCSRLHYCCAHTAGSIHIILLTEVGLEAASD